MNTWTLRTLDGAGPDGSTLYACHDETGALRGAACTPYPAEIDAARNGAELRRIGCGEPVELAHQAHAVAGNVELLPAANVEHAATELVAALTPLDRLRQLREAAEAERVMADA